MDINYRISNQTLNAIFEFSKLHALLYSTDKKNPWVKYVKKLGEERAAYAAVTIDSAEVVDIQTKEVKVPTSLKKYFNDYKFLKNNLSAFFKSGESFGVDSIDKLHARIMGIIHAEHKFEIRENTKEIRKLVNADGVYKYMTINVQTPPEEIPERLDELSKWLTQEYKTINPILLAAIVHYKIITIHPYADGNGRLARIFVHGILYMFDIDIENIIPIEEYFLKYRDKYYELIDNTQKTSDLSEWIEFFSSGLLYAVRESVKALYQFSGGTIDLYNNKIISVTSAEQKIIDLLNQNSNLSGADIARLLKVSRQNINSILSKMYSKKIVLKKGTGSGSRYFLISQVE